MGRVLKLSTPFSEMHTIMLNLRTTFLPLCYYLCRAFYQAIKPQLYQQQSLKSHHMISFKYQCFYPPLSRLGSIIQNMPLLTRPKSGNICKKRIPHQLLISVRIRTRIALVLYYL